LTASEEILQQWADRDDATPYDVAIQHANEVALRSHIAIADLVIDTGATSPKAAAAEMVEHEREYTALPGRQPVRSAEFLG
jgi:hypothetical protein